MSETVASQQEPRVSRRWWFIPLVVTAWFGLWWLTPGLLANGVGRVFTSDDEHTIVIETGIAFALAVVLVLTHRRKNRVLFARSRAVWLYALPLVLAIALPFHYEQALPVLLYMAWMTVSVFWQDYLTFGLLQSYLREKLPTWAVIVLTATVFWLGHALLIPHRFGPDNLLPSVAILALGLVIASLRARLSTLHAILALHLAFYFAFS